MEIKIAVLWDVKPSSSVERLRVSKQSYIVIFCFIILTVISTCTACTIFVAVVFAAPTVITVKVFVTVDYRICQQTAIREK